MLSEVYEVSLLARRAVCAGGPVLCGGGIHLQTPRTEQRTTDLLRLAERVRADGEQDSVPDDQRDDGKRGQRQQRRHDYPAQEHPGDVPGQQHRHRLRGRRVRGLRQGGGTAL